MQAEHVSYAVSVMLCIDVQINKSYLQRTNWSVLLIWRGNRIRVQFEIECGTSAKSGDLWLELTVIGEIMYAIIEDFISIHDLLHHILTKILRCFFPASRRQLIAVIISKI